MAKQFRINENGICTNADQYGTKTTYISVALFPDGKQICSRLSKENDGARLESWVYLTNKGKPLHELRRFIPNPLRKKYHL